MICTFVGHIKNSPPDRNKGHYPAHLHIPLYQDIVMRVANTEQNLLVSNIIFQQEFINVFVHEYVLLLLS